MVEIINGVKNLKQGHVEKDYHQVLLKIKHLD